MQGDLLRAFFEREQRLFLTGGAALAGFYFGHRTTEDLDLFSGQSLDLEEIGRVLETAAEACGATLRSIRTYPGFRRFLASRSSESCVVDLVLDRAPSLETEKVAFGQVRVDTLREIAANKLCTLLGRSEIKDLVGDPPHLATPCTERGQLAEKSLRCVREATDADRALPPDRRRLAPRLAGPGAARR